MEKATFRPKEAARYLSVGLSTFWLYVQQKKIKTVKLSDQVTIVTKAELDAFITARAS
jgi:excisionase family DNA binding protein